MNVKAELRGLAAQRLKRDVAEDTKLADTGLDSLDVMELAFDIEDHFKIQLPQMGSEMLSITLADLARLVEQQLAAKNKTAIAPGGAAAADPASS